MKNRLVLFIAFAVLFFVPVTTQAGFLVKKQATVQTAAISVTTATTTEAQTMSTAASELTSALREARSPSRTFVNMLHRGQISTLAFIFGLLGVFIPIFAIGAITFGFMGFAYHHSGKKGLAVAGFVLGLATIIAMSFAGYTALPIF